MRKELWEFTGRRSQIWLRLSRRTSRRKWRWRRAWKDDLYGHAIIAIVNSRLLSKSCGTNSEMEHILQMVTVLGHGCYHLGMKAFEMDE